MKTMTLSILAAAGLALPAFAGPGSLVSIGDLPGGAVVSEALGVSPDGLTVVGVSIVSGTNQAHAVSWTRDGGLVDLGLKSGGVMRSAYAINNAGTFCGETTTPEAAKGTLAGPSISILPGTVPNGFFGSGALAISGSGGRAAGSRELPGFIIEACYWDGTTVHSIGNLSSDPFLALAQGISDDGSVIVGYSDSDDGYEAFKWTQGGGMVSLGVLPGALTVNSNANGISRDGSVIVGNSANSTGGTRAVRWETGTSAISELPGQTGFGDAWFANLDGSVIVGRAIQGGPTAVATVWDANGIHKLSDLLIAKGVDLTGWTLTAAYSVSEDGLTIVGTGTNPAGQTAGYVAYLGTPCVSDVNNDSVVDLADFFDFLNAFDATADLADVNYDGEVDLGDFFGFLNAFDASC